VAVKQQISAANVDELARQRKLVEGGIQAAKQKDTKRAQQMFEAAEALGKKLVAKGENVIEQRARLRIVKQQLDIARKTSSERFGKGLKQIKKLRQSGRIAEAGAIAEKLAKDVDELSNSGAAGITFELQKEREQLALESAKATLKQGQGEGHGPGYRLRPGGWVYRRGGDAVVANRPDDADKRQPTRRPRGFFDPGAGEGRADEDMDGQRRPAGQTLTGESRDDFQPDLAQPDRGTIQQVYKVGDLVTALSDAEGDSSGLEDLGRKEADRSKRTSRLTEQVKSLLRDSNKGNVQITTYNGQRAFVVTAGRGEQEAVSKLIEGLRQARGPQVQIGSNLALQRGLNKQTDGSFTYGLHMTKSRSTGPSIATGTVTGGTVLDVAGISSDRRHMTMNVRSQDANADGAVDGKDSGGVKLDPDLQSFIDKNYAWQKKRGGRPDGSNSRVWQKAIKERAERDQIQQARMERIRQNKAKLANAAARRKKMAAAHLTRGKQLLESGKASDAVGELQTTVQLDPTLTEARKLLGLARKLADSSGGSGVLSRLIHRGDFMPGKAIMEYEKALQESKELMTSANSDADFAAAKEAAKAAGKAVETSKSLFASDKYRQMQAVVARQIEWIGENRDKWIIDKTNAERKQIEQARLEPSGTITSAGNLDAAELARKLRFNRWQKTNVSSLNINVDSAAANSLGINFHKGNNDVSFTVVDEAQFRTLMEMDAARRAAVNGDQVGANETRQDTIVGTDALLANDMTTNVIRSRDRGNTLDIADNPISLAHEKYVLIDNNGYLTAVRAGEMQNWQEASKHVEFVQAPQEIDIPRVGELVKLEKTLVKPSDEMVVRFDYQWKGR